MKKIKSLFLPFVTILVVMSSGAGCKKSGTKSSAAAITAFSFATPAATGTITGTNISVVLTEVTDLTKLVATFALSNGATAKVGTTPQVSGTTPNDFTSPKIYTVTAQDNTTKDYIVTVTAAANYVTIPDNRFREFLKTIVPDAFDGTDPDKLNAQHTSVTSRTSIIVGGGKGIADLTGIEYFVSLETLDLYNNDSLTTLDVSKNTALIGLSLGGNNLSTLDVSKNTALTNLICSYNKLSTLDVSKNTALTALTCYSNQLTSLDLSKNTALTSFSCYSNKLTYLDISSQKSWATNANGNGLSIYVGNSGENPLTTLKVNVSAQGQAAVKQAKTNNPSCVISTYTNNSTEVPVDANYTPQ